MPAVTPNPLPADIAKVQKALARDKSCNFGGLEYYLKQIINNKDVTFALIGEGEITIPAKKAWEIIALWGRSEQGGLPVGDRDPRFNIRSGATHLLNYIETNISGKTAEAAANYHHILEQSRSPITIKTTADPQSRNLQHIYDLRRIQTDIIQAGLIGKLTTRFEQSDIFKNLPEKDRRLVLQTIAVANANFRYSPKEGYQNFAAERLHQLLLHNPGIGNYNQIMRLANSQTAQEDFKKIANNIESTVREDYGGNEEKFQKDNTRIRSLGRISPSLNSIAHLIDSVDIGATATEKNALIRNLRTQLVSSASGNQHIDGLSLLRSALKASGLPEGSADYFQNLSPYLEEIEVKQRHILLGPTLADEDSRLIATSGLAAEIGVDPNTPWIKEKQLAEVENRIVLESQKAYFEDNPGAKDFDIQKAFDYEHSKGQMANFERLADIEAIIGKRADFNLYHSTVDGNFGYQFQELLGKSIGNYQAIKQPIDRFTEKTWGGIMNIDDIIRWPARQTAEWWERTVEKIPWLNPGALIANKLADYQTGIALKIHAWAVKSATADGATKFFATFARNIADFSEGFVKHDADWGRASYFFASRKVGNTVDWATRFMSKGKYGTFTALRGKIAQATWTGFKKLAPRLADKMIANGLSKVIIGIIAGEMTAGVSVAIQIGWEVLKMGFGFIKKIFTDAKFRERFINRIPIFLGLALSSSLLFLGGVPAAIVAGIGLLGAGIFALLQAALLSLAPLFALAGAIAIGSVAFMVLVWNIIISPTFNLDSGSSMINVPGLFGEIVDGNGCVQAIPAHGTILQGPHGTYSHNTIVALDILTKDGDPVFSAASGKVVFTGYMGVYGNRIDIETKFLGKTVTFIYGHLSSIGVNNGQEVGAGQQIGRSGSTSSNGNYANPHLHFEIAGAGDYASCPIPGTNPVQLEGCRDGDSCNESI